jgi:hypothetical protein
VLLERLMNPESGWGMVRPLAQAINRGKNMYLFRRLFGANSRKSSSTRRPPPGLRAQLGLEALETRLVPALGFQPTPLGGDGHA